MRAWICGAVLFSSLLLPKTGNAQALPAPFAGVTALRTHTPEVTAASADWFVRGAPIVTQGLVYYPTAAMRPFDANVMMQVGLYDNVPLYADATLEPFSVLYVPATRTAMRTYERLRNNELAGTTGSRTPAYPVGPVSQVPMEESIIGTSGAYAPSTGAPSTLGTVGTLGTSGTVGTLDRGSRRTRMQSLPAPRRNDGVWIQFDGTKYFSAGEATTFSADRFVQIGEYRGFPVYREKDSNKKEIWVTVVKDGPVAPYEKR